MNILAKYGRNNIILAAVLLIIFAIVYSYIFDSKIDFNGDNASYYMLGKAIHNGDGYVSANSIFKTPNNHFPPGYPFLISLVMVISDSFVAIKLLNGLLFVGILFLTYRIVERFTSVKTVSILTVLFLIFNIHLLEYSSMMMSEIPFIYFSLLALSLFLKSNDVTESRRQWIYYAAAFLSMMVAFYLRTLGIALLAAFCLMFLFAFRQKWKILVLYILGFALLYAPWFIRSQKLGGSSYIKQLFMVNPYRIEEGPAGLMAFITRFFKNIERYITREIPDVMFPFKEFNYREPIAGWEWIPGILLAALIVIGLWKLAKDKWLLIIYLTATFGVLFLWPDVWVGVRFVLPLLPLLYMVMFVGLQHSLSFIGNQMGMKTPIPIWISGLVLLFNISGIGSLNTDAKSDYEPKWRNYFNLAKSFQNEGQTDLVVSCRKPVLFYLYSGTYTTNYKYTPDENELLEDLKKRKADYVVLDQLGYSSTYRYLLPAVQNNTDRFEVVAQLPNPDTYLLKFKP